MAAGIRGYLAAAGINRARVGEANLAFSSGQWHLIRARLMSIRAFIYTFVSNTATHFI